jgi:acyl-CoA thioesterase-1
MKKFKISKKKLIIMILFLLTIITVISLYLIKTNQNKKISEVKSNIEEKKIVLENPDKTRDYTIIAFGDSLTAGFGLNLDLAYPAQLEKKLIDSLHKVKVVNSGVSGETSIGNLERAKFIRNQNPQIVLLGIGGNDALRGLDIYKTRENIEKSIDILTEGEKAPKVFLLKIQSPNNLGIKYKNEFDSIYKDISEKKKVPLIPFVIDEVFLNKEYMLNDGIHPNAKGYEIILNKYIYPEIIKYLEK